MKMEKKENQKSHKEIIIVLLLLLCISVGFSVLSSQLDVIGNTTIKTQSWDVHFDTVTEATGNVPGTTTAIASLGSASVTAGKSTEVKFDSTLSLPGDYYEFTVKVVNNGSIDAMLDNQISNTELTDAQKKYMTYEVTYEDGTAVQQYDAIHAGKSVNLKIKVAYKKDVSASDLPNTGDSNFASTYSINFVQADSNANFKTTK